MNVNSLVLFTFADWSLLMELFMLLDVFNTEGHPLKAAPASADTTFGTGSTITSNRPFTTVQGNLPSVSAINRLPGLVLGPQRRGIVSKILGIITG